MNIFISLIASLIIILIIISPFFWLKFLKEKSRRLYVFLSLAIVIIIFILFIRADIYLGDWFYNKDINYYTIYDSIYITTLIFFKFVSSFSPFLILKIMNIKFTLIKIIIAIIIAVLIYIAYPIIVFFIGIPALIAPALGL